MIQSNRLAIYAIGKIKKLWIRDGINQFNTNSKKDNFSKKLTTEEELYDEFNYLLDE